MKRSKFVILVVAAALMSAYSVRAGVFPLVKLNISGTVSYNATNTPSDDGKTTRSVLTRVSINTKSLINLLNASTNVTNTLLDVTGTNQIPAGSFFVYDLDQQNLIVTNKNGFSFVLAGTNSVTTNIYTYASLRIDQLHLIGSYSQNDSTGAGNESDLTGIYFLYNDSHGNMLGDYGNGTLKWSFGKVSGGVQKTTLRINFPAPNGYQDTVNFKNAIAQNVKLTGSGTGNVAAGIFPFYVWWFL